MIAFLHLGADLRRFRVNADGLRIENKAPAVKGGLGPIRHPVGAHTPDELQLVVRDLLRLGGSHPVAARHQVFAGLRRRLVMGVAVRELVQGGLVELSVLLGSGKLGTPRERTHWAKASSWEFTDGELVEPLAFDVPPEPVDDGLPPPAGPMRPRR